MIPAHKKRVSKLSGDSRLRGSLVKKTVLLKFNSRHSPFQRGYYNYYGGGDQMSNLENELQLRKTSNIY